MGLFGYSFVNLTKEQVHARRTVLDHYALVAQLSVFVVLLGLQLYHLSSWLSRRCGQSDEEQTPSSPYLKAEIENEKASWMRWTKQRLTNIAWWMQHDLAYGWGTRSEWLCGALWLSWLLTLCINATGNGMWPDNKNINSSLSQSVNSITDYMHLTKRFGIVAASQLPLHYLLAMKSAYSPLQILTRMSHEQLNSAHQVLGKVIQCLLTLHAVFYLNFFSRINVLAKRANDLDVILGFVCIIIITIISTSAIKTIRKWSYRTFYTIHVVLATLFLPLAYFHVHHIRPFIWQSASVYVIHLILRVVNSSTHEGNITIIPGTSLIQIKIRLTTGASKYKPGQHLYLSLPQGHRGTRIPNFFLRNPFTVASLPQNDGEVVLVARVLKGSTASYASLAREAELQAGASSTLPLRIEGPYGAASHLPDFTKFDRILLVAGGVGATFIIPIWRTILASNGNAAPHHQPDVRLVWAVRSLGEVSWALPVPELRSHEDEGQHRSEAEVFVTGVSGSPETSGVDSGESVELAETDALVSDDDEKAVLKQGIVVNRGRPDLHEVVIELCSGHVGRVAVLVCGPSGILKLMEREVRRQVMKGKDVYWHAEEFGL
jgi:ferredoxin-NADP reductase